MQGSGHGGSGEDAGGEYPSARQAAELERLSRQLDDLRRATGRRATSPGELARPAARVAAGTGSSRSAGTRSSGAERSSEPVGVEPIGLDAARRVRRSSRPEASGRRVADVLPFRRSASADQLPAAAPARRQSTGGRSLADREARKAASRAAAADVFAAQLATDPEEAARELCLGWLTVRPHTRAELAARLRRKGVPADAMSSVLDRYGEVGLIDDAAFANAWVDSRHTGRGLAKRALAYELRARGVDGATVDAALARLEAGDEEATARALVTRKLAGMGHVPPEARARRLMGMLARKGYSGGMAASVVREVIAGSGVEIPDPDLG